MYKEQPLQLHLKQWYIVRRPIRKTQLSKKDHCVDDIMTSLVFLHGGDVCPLESEVAVVLELSGARVCGEGQLKTDVSLSLRSLGGVVRVGGEAYHAHGQDQDGEDLDRGRHGALCEPLEEPRRGAGDLLKHCWCRTHIGVGVGV